MTEELLMVFYDVEHGSSAFVRTPNGKTMVIDLGVGSYKRTNETFSPLANLWHSHKVQHLDYVIITHPHRDHLDDIGNLHFFKPAALHTPRHLTDDEIRAGNRTKEGPIVEAYLQFRARYSQPVSTDKAIVPENLGGAKFDFFHPTACSRSNLNNHSMVTVITYAGCKILIPGDNEAPSWNELLQRTDFVQAIKGTDILVAPHHGREAGYSASLFDYISPRLTIVSDGPGSETSAVTKYSQKSSGWRVYSRSTPQGQGEIRKCISTRHDQTIVVKFGRTAGTQNNYINVTTA